MRKLFSKLWQDDAGVVTLEYLVLATILGLGVIVGVTAVTNALNTELSELAGAISGLNQDYTSTGFTVRTGGNLLSSRDGSFADDDRPAQFRLQRSDSEPNDINVQVGGVDNSHP